MISGYSSFTIIIAMPSTTYQPTNQGESRSIQRSYISLVFLPPSLPPRNNSETINPRQSFRHSFMAKQSSRR